MSKHCTKCNQIKENNLFYPDKTKKDNLSSYCIECSSIRRKLYYINNKKRERDNYEVYKINNKEKLLKYWKDYRVQNIDKRIKYQKDYRNNIRNSIWYRLSSRIFCLNLSIKDLKINKKEYIDYVISLFNEKYTIEDYFNGKIEIDHITPIHKFNNKIDGFKKENVQLLTIKEHKAKTSLELKELKTKSLI